MGCLKLTYQPTIQVLHTYELTPSREAKSVQSWLSVDPLADDAPGWTPYRYCFNNPINLIDPDGRSEGDPTKYYDQQGEMIEDVNDGIDQSVEVNREQYYSSKNAYTGGVGDFKSQADAKKFTLGYASLAKRFGQPYTLKGNWSTINDVLADVSFVLFKPRDNCNKLAVKQNVLGGAVPSGPSTRIDIATTNGQKIDPVSGNFMDALRTINGNLLSGYPVMVGLNEQGAGDKGNFNSATNHYANITGRGNDYYGNFYTYRDNAFAGGGRFYSNNGFLQSLTTEGVSSFSTKVTEIRPNVSFNR